MKTSSLIPTLEDKYLSWMRDEKKTFDENFYKKNFSLAWWEGSGDIQS